MNTFVILFCALALSVRGDAGAAAEVDESAVVVLGDDNFDDTIAKNEFVFAEFYAPWCGHCKHLVPEYARAAQILKDESSPVVVAKVDATQHQTVAQKYNVRGYPTLKFFRNGHPIEYEGGRTANEIVAFIKRKSGPPSKPLASSEEISNFKQSAGTKIIAYIAESNSEIWSDACKTFEDFSCAHVTDTSLFGDHKAPTAVIYKEGETDTPLHGEFTKESITSWAAIEGHPIVAELAQQVWQRSSTNKSPLIALFYEEINDANTKQARELGLKFKGKVAISISATKSIAERWGATGKKLPTAILVKWSADGAAKFTIFNEDAEDFTSETAENFIAQSLSGEYKGFKKSEPVPESNDGPVTILVGKNFEDIVYNKEKDVFVEFYAPWCGHCKKLSPIWDELGGAFKETGSVVIAKIDATANTVPENIEVRGFPTLIMFPADNKSGITYNGERDLPSLKKFVQEKASISVTKDEL